MTKTELAYTLARRNGVSPADAADQLDRAVTRIVRALRNGKPARLPGIGTIQPGKDWIMENKTSKREIR